MNTTNVIDTGSQFCTLYRFIFSVVIIGPICISGCIGNSISVVVLGQYDKARSLEYKSSTPLLLAALASSDILVLITVFMMKTTPSFFGFTGIYPSFFEVYPYLLVWGWPCVDLVHAYSSWLTVLVTIHRYIAVCLPHKARLLCSRSQAAKQILIVLVLCTLFELPVYLDFHVSVEQDENNRTILKRTMTELGKNEVYLIVYKTTAYYSIMYAIPLLMVAILTVLLVKALHKAKNIRRQMTKSDGHTDHFDTDDITRSLIVIVSIFMICQPWEPIRRIMETTLKSQPGCGHFYFFYEELPSLSFAVNSAANFAVYCLMGSKFRQLLKSTFGCRCRKAVNESVLGSMSSVSATQLSVISGETGNQTE